MSLSRILMSAIAMAIVLSLGVGTVESAIPNPTNEKFYACFSKKTGAVRLINYPKVSRCRRGERLRTWNAKGNPGATGPQGPVGPAGPQGPAGTPGITKIALTLVAGPSDILVRAGGWAPGDATCPVGKAVSGGLTSTSPKLYVTDSYLADPTTWRVWVHNSETDLIHHTFRPYVVCMTTEPGAVIARLAPAAKKAIQAANTAVKARKKAK